MCVIICLPPKCRIDHIPLFNAAANNWHSWGIIIRKDKKTELYREVPAEGCHKDIEKISKILQDNFDYERYVHFRHNTRGETTLDNAHPFTVFEGDDPVYFMHNGTFSNIPDTDTKVESDTSVFCTKYLKPLLKMVDGDFQSDLFKEVMFQGAWTKGGGNNRGLLVSGAKDALTIGSWTKHRSDGTVIYQTYNNASFPDFIASNDDYFKEVKRGPHKEWLQAEEARIREENRKAVQAHADTKPASTGSSIVKYDPEMFRPDPAILDGLKAYVREFNLFDDDCLADFGYCGIDYFEAMLDDAVENKRTKSVALFMEHILTRFQAIVEQNNKLTAKLDKATAKIATLVNEERKVG